MRLGSGHVMARFGDELAPIRRLDALHPISPETRTQFGQLLGQSQSVPPGSELISEGATISGAIAIIDGWACRCRHLSDGRRQIIQFALPGDVIGFNSIPRLQASTSLVALTGMTIAHFAYHCSQVKLGDVRAALASSATLDDLYMVNQVMRLGQMTAYERIAHLLFEIRDRLLLAGLISGYSFPMPLTQETLADALGLTSVHINRTLQQLRREHMVEISHGVVTLRDPGALGVIAEYYPQHIAHRMPMPHS